MSGDVTISKIKKAGRTALAIRDITSCCKACGDVMSEKTLARRQEAGALLASQVTKFQFDLSRPAGSLWFGFRLLCCFGLRNHAATPQASIPAPRRVNAGGNGRV